MVWPHNTSGKFSVKSPYSRLVQGRSSSKLQGMWRAHIPLKIKIFLWQAIRRRLPSSDQILCGENEEMEHILFRCVLAKFFWSYVRSWLNFNWDPNNFDELFALTANLSSQVRRVFWFVFAISLPLSILFLTARLIACSNGCVLAAMEAAC